MLKTKQVGKYTVSQIGALESARMRLFSKQIAALNPDEATEAALLDERDRMQDHIGSGMTPAPHCQWAARGMRCDCLLCVTQRRKP